MTEKIIYKSHDGYDLQVGDKVGVCDRSFIRGALSMGEETRITRLLGIRAHELYPTKYSLRTTVSVKNRDGDEAEIASCCLNLLERKKIMANEKYLDIDGNELHVGDVIEDTKNGWRGIVGSVGENGEIYCDSKQNIGICSGREIYMRVIANIAEKLPATDLNPWPEMDFRKHKIIYLKEIGGTDKIQVGCHGFSFEDIHKIHDLAEQILEWEKSKNELNRNNSRNE